MPSVLKPNLMFLASKSNSGYILSIFLHCDPSAGCLNIESCLRSTLCHCINLALSLFLNRRFKHGIIGEYHMTFTKTLFQGGSPSTSHPCLRHLLPPSTCSSSQVQPWLNKGDVEVWN